MKHYAVSSMFYATRKPKPLPPVLQPKPFVDDARG
jgi:hypothetical protein